MRPFRFNLEKVLEYRRQLEDQARLALARAQAARDAQAAALARVEAAMEANDAAMEAKKNPTSGEIWLWRAYRERLLLDRDQARALLVEREKELTTCRTQAIERSKDRKLLEKLKTNKAIRHAREALRAEQKENDEMATLRFGRDVADARS